MLAQKGYYDWYVDRVRKLDGIVLPDWEADPVHGEPRTGASAPNDGFRPGPFACYFFIVSAIGAGISTMFGYVLLDCSDYAAPVAAVFCVSPYVTVLILSYFSIVRDRPSKVERLAANKWRAVTRRFLPRRPELSPPS